MNTLVKINVAGSDGKVMMAVYGKLKCGLTPTNYLCVSTRDTSTGPMVHTTCKSNLQPITRRVSNF